MMNPEILKLKGIFEEIYGIEEKILEAQNVRYNEIISEFKDKFGEGELQFFSTPGRTEIGGNHTDHNHGRVLAGSINLDSIAGAANSGSDTVTVHSRGYDTAFQVELGDLEAVKAEEGTTTALIRGIAARLMELGYSIGGFNACIASDVLPGSGLSSSASIEVLIGTIFNALFNDNAIPPETLAIVGQYSENNYFGKPCGLMDQVACAVGGIVTIDFKDPQNPVIKKVDFDFNAQGYNLVVVDTGGTHADLTDDYASVPEEMRSVAQILGKEVCREITMEDVMKEMQKLRSGAGDRAVLRAIHFLGDNERVVQQVEALEKNDFKRFLQLITESGNSSYKRLQNINSPKSTREMGVALALILTEDYLKQINAGAGRVHGGGFAGTIQVFLPAEAVPGYMELMEPVFGEGSVHVLKIRSQGSMPLNSQNI